MDPSSFWSGIAKFSHDQKPLEEEFYNYLVAVLDFFFPLMKYNSDVVDDDTISGIMGDVEHEKKSSGFPWNVSGMPTKKSVLTKHDLRTS